MKKKITTECDNVTIVTYYLNDNIHNDDGPARIIIEPGLIRYDYFTHGVLNYYEVNETRTWVDQEGRWHRTDGPAAEYADGTKEWYIDGLRHRIDGPAAEYADGGKAWYLNGERHRECGPAVELKYGNEWWLNGKRHRLDGPAIEWSDGSVEWWVNGMKQRRTAIDEKVLFVMSASGCRDDRDHILRYYKMIGDIGCVYKKFPDLKTKRQNAPEGFFMSEKDEVYNITNTTSRYVAMLYKKNLHRFFYHKNLDLKQASYPYKKFHVYDKNKSVYIFSTGSVFDAIYRLSKIVTSDTSINGYNSYVIQPEYELPSHLYISLGEIESHIARVWAREKEDFKLHVDDLHKLKQCRMPLSRILQFECLNIRVGELRAMHAGPFCYRISYEKIQEKSTKINNALSLIDSIANTPGEKIMNWYDIDTSTSLITAIGCTIAVTIIVATAHLWLHGENDDLRKPTNKAKIIICTMIMLMFVFVVSIVHNENASNHKEQLLQKAVIDWIIELHEDNNIGGCEEK